MRSILKTATAAIGMTALLAGTAMAGGLSGDLKIFLDTSNPAPRATMEKMIGDFQKLHPDLKIETTIIDREAYKTQIRNFLTANAPDVATWYAANRMRPYVDAGLFEDVSDLWQEPAVLLFKASAPSGDLLQWGLDQLQNLGMIVVVIFVIVLCMRLLRAIGFLALLEKILAPVLPFFGMSHRAAPITVVGMIMGIGYGGALIIRETNTGKLAKAEVFNSMALMGLCHDLVEDTLVMAAIGGKLGGILWGRIVFSLIVTYLLVKVLRILADRRIRQHA